MKQLLLITLLCVFANSLVHSQNCTSSPYLKEGKQFVFLAQLPDATKPPTNGALADKTVRETFMVKSVKNDGGNIMATISLVKWEDSSNPNATNPLGNVLGAVVCTGHSFQYIYNVNSAKTSYNDTLEFPFSMAVGDNLPPKNKSLTMNRPGGQNITVAINMTFNVAAKETITTPAGTWDCFKIVMTSTSQMPAMGKFAGGPMTQTQNMWFAPGIGLIKTQTGQRISVTLQSL